MVKKAVEQTGLIPRSIIRTFDRFRKQLFPEAEKLIIQEFRISRYQFLVSIKCLLSLIFIPFIVNFLIKNFLLIPLTENLWNTRQPDIFLNSYQQDQAFNELRKFQEKLYFDYLLTDVDIKKSHSECFTQPSTFFCLQTQIPTLSILKTSTKKNDNFISIPVASTPINQVNIVENFVEKQSFFLFDKAIIKKELTQNPCNLICEKYEISKKIAKENLTFSFVLFSKSNETHIGNSILHKNIKVQDDVVKQLIKKKTLELAIYHNHKSILALTNLIGDFITFLVIILLIVYMKPQISILKSFLTESIYSLNDTKKSFLLILGTDLLVGFHSPRGWEICLELILRYFGFPENKNFVFLFVATFPVLLDTVFKYWIFRYLNKISPSTVATYHSMIE